MMNRRGFFRFLGLSSAAAAVATVAPKTVAAPETPTQPKAMTFDVREYPWGYDESTICGSVACYSGQIRGKAERINSPAWGSGYEEDDDE